MELEYIDHEELGVTPEFINEVIDELADADTHAWDDHLKWWETNDMPQGLQVVELHTFPTVKEYVLELLKRRNIEPTDRLIVQCALTVDDMIT